MTDSVTPVETMIKGRRKRKWRGVAIVLGAILFGVWFLTPSGGIERPVKLERGEDGRLEIVCEDSGEDGLTLKAHAGVVNARNSTSTATSTSHSDPGWFRAESLTILNHSDHLLMKRVGKALLEKLQEQSNWKTVEYFPHGSPSKEETPRTDIYMIIDLTSLEESGIVRGHLDANVIASISNGLPASSHSVHDNLSSVMVEFRANANLEHESTLTGVESAGAKYSMQGAEIAKELAKLLANQIQSLREDYSAPPEEMNSLMAEYRPTPDFSDLGDLELIASTHREMVHNDTLWSFQIEGNEDAYLENASRLLQDENWKEYSKQITEHTKYLRMQQDTKWLEIYPKQLPFLSSRETHNEEQQIWYVRYRERMGREQLEKIYQQFLEQDPPDIDLLLALERLTNKQQREQLFQLVEEHQPTNPRGCLRLANWYFFKKQQEKAIQSLQRTNITSLFMEDRNDWVKKIDNLIKKHELDEQEIKSLSLEMLEAAGLQIITPEQPTANEEFMVGGTVAFVLPGESPDKWSFFGTSVLAAERGNYRLNFFDGDENGRRGSSSSCCLDLEHERRNVLNRKHNKVEIKVNKLDQKNFSAEVILHDADEVDSNL